MNSKLNTNPILKQKFRKFIRCVLYAAIFFSGIFFLVRFISNYRGKRVTILTFHRIGSNNNGKITHSLPTSFLSKRNFERTIKFLLKHYTVISLSDYLNKINTKEQLPKNSVIITFDDGYHDIYENGFQIFKKYKIPVIIFLTSSFMDSRKVFWWDLLYALFKNGVIDSSVNHFSNEIYTKDIENKLLSIFSIDRKKRDQLIISMITELQNYEYSSLKLLVQNLKKRIEIDSTTLVKENRMLSWNNIRELQSAGITFGSHTKSHVFFNDHLSKDIIGNEILNSKIDLENRLKNEIVAFAYPGGKISAQTKKLVKENGYKIACTQNSGINTIREDIFALKRINIWDGTVEGVNGRFSKSLLAITLIKNSFSA